MKLRTVLLGVAGIAVIAVVGHFAFHQFYLGPRLEVHRAAIQSMVAEYDTDKDTKFSRAEIEAAIASRFAKADTNSDGKIDTAEFKIAATELHGKLPAPFFRHRDPAEMQTRVFKAVDWNLDGGVTLEEARGPLLAMAGFADRNGDGVIAQDEMRGRWGHRRGMHAGL